MLAMFLNGTIYSVFSPLGQMFIKIYQVPVILFNINSLLMSLLYFPATFLVANFMFKKFGIHVTLAVGAALECLCLVSRIFINYSFALAMAGGFFYGIAQPLIMNANAEVASNWFDSNERPISIMLNSVVGPLGSGFGYVFHTFFVSSDDEKTPEVAKEHIFNLCVVSAIVFSIAFGIVIVFFRSKPPIPPTKSASMQTSESIMVSLKQLLHSKNYWFVMNAFGLTYGCICTFSQEVALVTAPFGLEPVF